MLLGLVEMGGRPPRGLSAMLTSSTSSWSLVFFLNRCTHLVTYLYIVYGIILADIFQPVVNPQRVSPSATRNSITALCL